MIVVTKPFLPPQEEYNEYVRDIWKRQWLTNMGPLSTKLENDLTKYLGVNNLLYVANGTLAIQIAIKALKLKGEIITTPFSYVATTSSIVWEGCTPVFVDIHKESLNINPELIEAAITNNTSAILATHVYGNPCDVEKINEIAIKHGLKVIYDAAHAFGVSVNNTSIFNFGHISTCSLHATKIYHSIEGGLVITKDSDLNKKMAYARNFGHDGPDNFYDVGINAKNSEFHAAMGLLNLNHLPAISARRKLISERYDKNLKTLQARKQKWHEDSKTNYSYYPLVFDSEVLLLKCIEALKMKDIFGRRYFFPSLAKCLPYVETKDLQQTDSIAKRVFCLPLYHTLSLEDVDLICNILLETQNK